MGCEYPQGLSFFFSKFLLESCNVAGAPWKASGHAGLLLKVKLFPRDGMRLLSHRVNTTFYAAPGWANSTFPVGGA